MTLNALYAQYLRLKAKVSAIIQSMALSGPSGPTALDKFCVAIRDYEGAPGDANYRNNNPGNCRYNEGGYLPKYEPVYRSPSGFAIFPSMAVGMLYLENLVREKITNHPGWTIMAFFQNYAPDSDGNDHALYAAFVARRLGVETGYLVKNLI